MTKRTINAITGEETIVEMSPEEIASLGQSTKLRVPDFISGRQTRLWLNQHFMPDGTTSMLAEVRRAINSISDDTQRLNAQIEFEHATEFERYHPLITFAGTALGLDENQIDEAFREAILL